MTKSEWERLGRPKNGYIDPNMGWVPASFSEAQQQANPYSGKPALPEFVALTKGSGYQLNDDLRLDPSGVKSAVSALRGEGLRTGPSKWAELAGQQQDVLQQKALEDLAASNASATQNAWSQLAMRGGVSGGERERIAESGLRALTDARQNALTADKQARLNIGMQDEQNRLGILSGLPGAELSALEPDRQNIATTIGERDKKAMFDMNNYNEQVRAWAANKQADAQAAAGKKN